MLQAVLWLHERGRGHCDIKGDNLRVKVSEDGTQACVKLVDLGCSIKFGGKPSSWHVMAYCTCNSLLCMTLSNENVRLDCWTDCCRPAQV